ncbi:hypothetical protein OCD81_27835 [Bacillus paranthracis]|uniref:hypothetical protein n=1 Tax=Bacillus paranthracis TaxID=2026186 RepID=UPI0021D1BD96|nr:hypothetical protein [Bacillus paranthracis]MCU4954490.1 hypothetical protein [Bacillus paranthracis]
MTEVTNDKIEKLEKKIESLMRQKQALAKREKEKKDKERTHRLLTEAGFLESLVGNLGKEEMKKKIVRMYVLEKLYDKQQIILRYLFGDTKLHTVEQLFQKEFLEIQTKVNKIRESKIKKKEEQIQEIVQRQCVFFNDLFGGLKIVETDSARGKLTEIHKLEDKYRKLIDQLIVKGGK